MYSGSICHQISTTAQWNGFSYQFHSSFVSKNNRSCQFWWAEESGKSNHWKDHWIRVLVWFKLKSTFKKINMLPNWRTVFHSSAHVYHDLGKPVLKISHQRQHQCTHLPLSQKIKYLLLQAIFLQPSNAPHLHTWFSHSAYSVKGPTDFRWVTGTQGGTSRFGRHMFCKWMLREKQFDPISKPGRTQYSIITKKSKTEFHRAKTNTVQKLSRRQPALSLQ